MNLIITQFLQLWSNLFIYAINRARTSSQIWHYLTCGSQRGFSARRKFPWAELREASCLNLRPSSRPGHDGDDDDGDNDDDDDVDDDDDKDDNDDHDG